MTKVKSHQIRVYNSSKQLIPLQARTPGGDFYTTEQQIRLLPGQDALLPKNHMLLEQIENLQKKGMIRVVYDSESESMKS